MSNMDAFWAWYKNSKPEICGDIDIWQAACELKDKDIEFLTKSVAVANDDSEYFRRQNESLNLKIAELRDDLDGASKLNQSLDEDIDAHKGALILSASKCKALEKNNAQLVDSLFGLIGVTDLAELRDMLEIMKVVPDPEGHSVIAIKAINCLLNIGVEK